MSMNALTIGSYAAIALMGILVALWLYRRGKAEGANEQEKENREANSEYMEDHAEDWYDGRIGTDALPVLDRDAWRESATPNIKPRVESRKNGSPKREKDGGKVHDA
ncbi:hypothetical protein LCGC14_1915160 [marine sediment metagenome]|uniref:Uncharacterized protein n=1 Tax=marine sediment metagenome TaxID=412755 RepID=A0A0F9IQF1_9ZZZZ